VTVSLGMPRLPKGKTDWECPFRISGGGIRVNECGYGVDAIQALQNALGSIRRLEKLIDRELERNLARLRRRRQRKQARTSPSDRKR
jgi:hypothetical protein